MPTRRTILIALLTLTAAIYLPGVFRNAFVSLDDTLLITKNVAIQGLSLENLRTIFTSYDPELYVPLTLLSYQIEYAIAGLHPALFHMTNLILHLCSAALVFAVVTLISAYFTDDEKRPRLLAAFVAVIFALHPLQVEAVAWAAARKDLLSATLTLLSLWTLLTYRERGKAGWYVASIAFFALALLAKVSVLLMPLMLVALDALAKQTTAKRIKEFMPLLALSLLFGIVALFGKAEQIRELPLMEHALIAAKSIGFYTAKFWLPTGLTVYQPELEIIAFLRADILLSLLATVLLAGVAWIFWKRLPLVTLGIITFALFVSPSFLNVWKNGMLYFASDRYVYLAIIGLALSVGTIASQLLSDWSENTMQTTIGALGLVLGVCTFIQSQSWRSSVTLYERALAIHPNFAVAASNLGSSLYEEGKKEEAMGQYKRALEIDPKLTQAYINIGLLKQKSGDHDGALLAFRTAVSVIPEDRPLLADEVAAHSFLASALDTLGQPDEAIATYRIAAKRAPENADAHYNLAVTLQKYSKFPEARGEFIAYLELRPRDLDARYRLAAVEAGMGLLPEAADSLEIIIDRDPHYEEAMKHLENIRRLLKDRQ